MIFDQDRFSVRGLARLMAAAWLAAALPAMALAQQQAPPSGAANPAVPRNDAEDDRLAAPTRALVGTWTGTITDAGQRVSLRVTMGADRSFHQVSRYPNGTTLTIRATWAITAPDKIEFDVIDWSPKQYCEKPGSCQPVNIERKIVKTFQFVDDNTVRTEDGEMRRER